MGEIEKDIQQIKHGFTEIFQVDQRKNYCNLLFIILLS